MSIEHTNEIQAGGWSSPGTAYGAITSHDFQYDSCKPVIYLFHGGGAQINWNGPIVISKGFNLCVSVFSPD